MRYSIIIVAYKDYASLEKCIASVRCSGISDYEIIVWDNTTDRDLNAPFSVVDFQGWDGTNHGFAKGCNLGAEQAKGDTLIFLNPDTQVFGNWADDMAKGIKGETVAVGPVSNFVAGFQKAEFYGGEDKGFRPTLLLIGFCLMIRADVFRELGGMDESMFLGCDDLDLSWRIQRARYKMAIATGVFVHHEGHTSMNLNPEKEKLIKQSSDAMREKLKDFYGPDVPSSVELWGCKILATDLKPMRLSVCMIVRDASKDLEVLLPQLEFADQIVVVDTGTNDRHDHIYDWFLTRKNEYQMDNRFDLFYHDWVDDFAAARNFALSKCTGDWVLWLDADDRISPESAALIDTLIHKPGNNVALQACHFAFRLENTSQDGSIRDSFFQPRLFPRLPGIEWGGLGGCKGFAHESYFDNCHKLGLPMVVVSNITITHTGYSDPELEKAKSRRNLALLLKEPENAFKWYHIGCSYMITGELEKSEESFRKSLEMDDGSDKGFADNIRYNLAMSLSKMDSMTTEVYDLLSSNSKPDAKWLLGMLKIEYGEVIEGCDLLWAYLKMGDIKDNMGTNCPTFRKAAVGILTEIGVLKV